MSLKERIAFGVIALAAGLIGGLASGPLWNRMPVHRPGPAPVPDTIVSHSFVLADRAGERRAKLEISPEGIAAFDIYDAQGLVRSEMSVLPDGTAIFSLAGDSGKPSLALNALPNGGGAALEFFNPDGTGRAEMSMRKGDPAIILCDHKGNRLMRINVENDEPALALYDSTGTWRSLTTLNPDGTPELGFADQNGKPRAMIGLQSDGRATFIMSNDGGKAVAILGQTPDGGPSLELLDADGSIVGKLP